MSSGNSTLVTFGAGVACGVAALVLARRLTKYTPPKVWKWTKPSGGKWGGTNAPTAGARTSTALAVGKHPVQLHSLGTPNGVKVTIMLEELCEADQAYDYDAFKLPIDGAQFGSGFVEVTLRL